MCAPFGERYRVLSPAGGAHVSAPPLALPACPTAVRCRLTGSFTLPRARVLFGARPPTARPDRLPLDPCGPSVRVRAPSWGLPVPSSRHRPAASTHARAPKPGLRSVPGVSHALDGLLRHRPCGLVSSRCHVKGSAEGVLHAAEQYRVTPAGALVPFGPARLRLPAPAHRPSASGPCSPRRVQRATDTGESSRWPAPFDSASSGCSPPAPPQRLHATNAHDLRRDEPAAMGLQRVAGAGSGWPGTRLPTRSRFPA
jgi:hypothetical protein